MAKAESADIEEFARYPEDVWRFQVQTMPKEMLKVDKMLRAGRSPEWICSRGEWFDLPVEIQTLIINSLHWRQSELRKGQ